MTTSADEGAIAEVGAPTRLRPDPSDTRAPWWWTTASIAAAALVLAVFNASAIGGWIDELTPGPLNAPLRTPVVQWTTAVAAHGLDTPRTTLRRLWQAAQAARFGSEQPGQQGASDAP